MFSSSDKNKYKISEFNFENQMKYILAPFLVRILKTTASPKSPKDSDLHCGYKNSSSKCLEFSPKLKDFGTF